MGNVTAGTEPDEAAEARGRANGAGGRGRGSKRLYAGRWALGGALWGVLSLVVRGVFPHQYFELVGYRTGRMLQWLMPAWWAARIDEGLGVFRLGSDVLAFFVASALLGSAAGLALWWVVERIRRIRTPG
jgi:hypothetical protein